MASPVLMIATFDVHNEEKMEEYRRLVRPTLQQHGARRQAIDLDTQTLEGTWLGARTVVIELTSVDAVKLTALVFDGRSDSCRERTCARLSPA